MTIKRNFQYSPSQFEISIEEIQYERGFVFYHLKDYQSALIDFSNIPSQSRSSDTQYMVGACLLMLGRDVEACVELNLAVIKGDNLAKSLLDKYCK
ncbi:MAG: hypothetical protein JKY02_07665 [Flavobacteriaceae bacterium]|nr:hypothetical protein [Flavobacteriaceae bacterium]